MRLAEGWESFEEAFPPIGSDLERPYQAGLLREVVGPLPFRPIRLRADGPGPCGANVTRIAQAVYERGSFADPPGLTDALEEAGCDNADILAHCRQAGPHVRGCWVVDALLGKQ